MGASYRCPADALGHDGIVQAALLPVRYLLKSNTAGNISLTLGSPGTTPNIVDSRVQYLLDMTKKQFRGAGGY